MCGDGLDFFGAEVGTKHELFVFEKVADFFQSSAFGGLRVAAEPCFHELEIFQNMTVADVQRVARTYFTPENRTVLTIMPAEAGGTGGRAR